MDNYYVYILKCSDGTLYTGSTNNLDKRLACHNSGQGARYTRARLPVTMEYTEGPLGRGDALRREAAIKALSREKKLALIGWGVENSGLTGAERAGSGIEGVEMENVEMEVAEMDGSNIEPGLERLGGWPNQTGNRGTLYLVPTPIGNLEDITLRALRVLKEADLIAAEDTRHTRKLLTHFDIAVPLTSYHQHNRHSKGEKLVEMLEEGKNIALVTDAGMPGISDPGHDLVMLAWERNIPAVVLPGASAGLVALIASGLDTTNFMFQGFLSQDNKERREQLKSLERSKATNLIYEAPHRLCKTLRELAPVLGERQIAVARELTKKFEEVLRGSAVELEKHFKDKGVKGEFVLVIQGSLQGSNEENSEWWSGLSEVEHVEALIKQNFDKKEAIKQVAKSRNLPKREVYQMVIRMDKDE